MIMVLHQACSVTSAGQPAQEFRCPAHRRRPVVQVFQPGKIGREIIVKDAIADAFLQQILLRPAEEYDVIARCNLERRLYLRRAGGSGGAVSVLRRGPDKYAFPKPLGTGAPKYAGLNKVESGSLIAPPK